MLLGWWVGLVMVSVAFSTRQDYYSMSCWGAVATFLAWPWVEHGPSLPRWTAWLLLVPSLLVAAGGLFALLAADLIQPHLAALGHATAAPIKKSRHLHGCHYGISPALWGRFIDLLWFFGMAMVIAGGAATVWTWQRRFFPAFARAQRRHGGAGHAGRGPGSP